MGWGYYVRRRSNFFFNGWPVQHKVFFKIDFNSHTTHKHATTEKGTARGNVLAQWSLHIEHTSTSTMYWRDTHTPNSFLLLSLSPLFSSFPFFKKCKRANEKSLNRADSVVAITLVAGCACVWLKDSYSCARSAANMLLPL